MHLEPCSTRGAKHRLNTAKVLRATNYLAQPPRPPRSHVTYIPSFSRNLSGHRGRTGKMVQVTAVFSAELQSGIVITCLGAVG